MRRFTCLHAWQRHGSGAALLAAAVFSLLSVSCSDSPSTPTTSNSAPTVSISFPGGSTCSPGGGASCTVEVLAQASDPDGDALQYTWSGCATGAAARATCTISALGAATASISVSDGHGHTVSASATAQGVSAPNAPPRVSVAFEGASSCTLVGNACTVNVVATATDPDGDPLTYKWSGCAAGTGAKAPCTITHVGPATATVEVGDDHGNTVNAEATGTGVEDRNRPPTVSLSFDGASQCTPQPVKPLSSGGPCSVKIVAQASDPDGDSLSYTWSGCTAGHSGTRATCVVGSPGPVDAILEVDDGRGHRTTARATAVGLNQPPGVFIGYVTLLPSGNAIDLLGAVTDPDEGGMCGSQYCVSAKAEGACRSAFLRCSCLAGLEAEVTPTAVSGICTVTFTLKDTWGQIGTPVYSFDVATARATVAVKKQ